MTPTKKSEGKGAKKPAKAAAAKQAPKKPVSAGKASAKKPAAEEAPPKPVAAEPPPAPAPTPQADLIDIARLAVELHQPLLQVRKMVQSGQIPGVKVDGEWRFNLQLVREAMLRRSRGF